MKKQTLQLAKETLRSLTSSSFVVIRTDNTHRIAGGQVAAPCPNANVPHGQTGPDDPDQTVCGHSVLSNCFP